MFEIFLKLNSGMPVSWKTCALHYFQLQKRSEQMKKSLEQQQKELDDKWKEFEKEKALWEEQWGERRRSLENQKEWVNNFLTSLVFIHVVIASINLFMSYSYNKFIYELVTTLLISWWLEYGVFILY